jgi:transcriptional regulator
MPTGARYTNRIDLLQGTLDLIILQTLRWGPQHGYAISQAINANSRDAFKVETGSLYPALHRLEKQGWIASAWGTTDNKQRARIYRLTAAGRRQLSAEQSRWSRFVEAMSAVLKPRNEEA